MSGFGKKVVTETANVPVQEVKDDVYLSFAAGHMWRVTLASLVIIFVFYFASAVLFYFIFGENRSALANVLMYAVQWVIGVAVIFWCWGKVFQKFILREKVVRGYELALQADTYAPDLSKEWAVWSVAFAHAWPVVIIQFAVNQVLVWCAEIIIPQYGYRQLFSILALIIGVCLSSWRLKALIGRSFGGYRLVIRPALKD